MDDATGDQYTVNAGDAWPDYMRTPNYRTYENESARFRGQYLAPPFGEPRPDMRGLMPPPLTNPPYTFPSHQPVGPQRPVVPYIPNPPPAVVPESGLDQWEQLYRWNQYGVPARIITAPAAAAVAPPTLFAGNSIWLLVFFFVVLIFACLICSRSLSTLTRQIKKFKGGGRITGGDNKSCGCSCCQVSPPIY